MPRSQQITDAGPIAQLSVLTTAPTVFQQSAPFSRLNQPSLAAILAVPGTRRLEKKLVTIRNSGVIFNAGGATTTTLGLYSGTDTVVANNTLLAVATAATLPANAFTPFMIETRLLIDSNSGTAIGDVSGIVGTTIIPKAALSSTPTGLNALNEPVLNLVFAVTIAAANALNYAILDTFGLEE